MKLLSPILLLLALQVDPASADFVVAPGGDDAGPGTRERPFATVGRAREAVRALKAKKPATVLLRGGTYFFPETLVFTPEDSGTAEAPVTYAAWPGEKPVLFADPAKGDFTLRPESPALKLGFQPIDVSKVGPRKGAPLVEKRRRAPVKRAVFLLERFDQRAGHAGRAEEHVDLGPAHARDRIALPQRIAIADRQGDLVPALAAFEDQADSALDHPAPHKFEWQLAHAPSLQLSCGVYRQEARATSILLRSPWG
jgi:hypothetical protein